MTHERSPHTVKTARTVFSIVEALRETNGSGVTELARRLGVAKSTVHRHLSTLEELEYVEQRGDEYALGLKFLELGEHTRKQNPAYVLTRKKVDELATESGERAQFIVAEHGVGVYVHRQSGERAVETDSEIGKRIPLHATAAGKAILAFTSPERVEAIVERRSLERLTETTVTDYDELSRELAEIRERGYSFNDQENTQGLRAVGVPVRTADDSVLGALSVSGPTHRLKGDLFEHEIPDLLLGTANELELNIKYSNWTETTVD